MAIRLRGRRLAEETASNGEPNCSVSRLHPADDQHPPAPADQVDLTSAEAPVPLDDLAAVLEVPVARRVLTQASQRCAAGTGRRPQTSSLGSASTFTSL